MNKGKEQANHQPTPPAEPDMDVNQMVRFDLSSNEEIFTEEQKENIIKMFPESIQHFLKTIKNPLDEKEVLINIFKNKNVRIIIIYEQDILGDMDWIPYFHCPDIAKISKYPEKHVDRWNSTWKLNIISYENLLLKIEEQMKSLPKIGEHIKINFEGRQTDKKSFFINYNDLKKALIKINTDESLLYEEWLLRQSTIMSKFLKHLHEIKKNQEMEQKNYEIEKYKQQVKQIEHDNQIKMEEMKKRVEKAIDIYPMAPKQKGYVYIVCSEFLKSKGLVRIGRTLNIEKRESQYRCSDPTYAVEYYRDVEDKMLTEKAIHYILNNIRKYSNREFFYCSSLDETKEIINKCIDLIEEQIIKQEEITKEIRKKYMEGEITELIEEEEETRDESIEKIIKKCRPKSPAKRNNSKIILSKIQSDEIQSEEAPSDETHVMQESFVETNEYNNIINEYNDMNDINNESVSSNQILPYSTKTNDKSKKERGRSPVKKINPMINRNDDVELSNETYKKCEKEDYESFAGSEIIKPQPQLVRIIYKKFLTWCIQNEITKIPEEKEMMENLNEYNCEIIIIGEKEHVIKRIGKKKEKHMDDEENDPMMEFKNEHIKFTGNKKNYIIWTLLKEEYEAWYKGVYKKEICKTDKLKSQFEEKVFNKIKEKPNYIGKIKNTQINIRGWINYKMINTEKLINTEKYYDESIIK